ncbi:hypothetical protein CLV63_102468, partial [Murinocardiopsis flavida]
MARVNRYRRGGVPASPPRNLRGAAVAAQTSGLPEESAVAVADCDGDRCPRPAERVEAL